MSLAVWKRAGLWPFLLQWSVELGGYLCFRDLRFRRRDETPDLLILASSLAQRRDYVFVFELVTQGHR